MRNVFLIILLFGALGGFAQNNKVNRVAVERIFKDVRTLLTERNFSSAKEKMQSVKALSVMIDSIEFYERAIDYYSSMDEIYKAMKGKDIKSGIDLYNQFKKRTEETKVLKNDLGVWIAIYNLIPVVMENHWFATAVLADSLSALSKLELKNEMTFNNQKYYLKGSLVDLIPASQGICGAYFTFCPPENLPHLPFIKPTIEAVTDNIQSIVYFDTEGNIISRDKITVQNENPFYNLLIPHRNEKGKWGYLDRKGNEIIPCKYDDASFFSFGLAVIRNMKKVAYVDIFGNSTLKSEWREKEKNDGK